jgi:hypothetical protein
MGMDRRTVKYLLIAACVFCGLVVVCCGGLLLMPRPTWLFNALEEAERAQQNQPAEPSPSFTVGQNATLYWDGKGLCYVPINAATNENFWQFVRAGNTEAIKGMQHNHYVLVANEGTTVSILNVYADSCAVRVLDGEYQGLTGFVATQCLRPVKLPSADRAE